MFDETEYNGYYITFNFYGRGEYTVQYAGDDVVFNTANEARAFIDEVTG